MSSKYLKHLKEKKKQEKKQARLQKALLEKKTRNPPFISSISRIKDEMLGEYAGVLLFYLELELLPVDLIMELTGMSSSLAAELNSVLRKKPNILIDEMLKILPTCIKEAQLKRDIPFEVRYAIEPATENPHHHVDFNIGFVVASDLDYDIRDIPLRENPNAETIYSALVLSYLNYYALGLTNTEHVNTAIRYIRIPAVFDPKAGRLEDLSACTLINQDKLPKGFVINR